MSAVAVQPSLREMEHRLHDHFKRLKAWKTHATDVPVFALEHPLDGDEFDHLSVLLNEEIRLQRNLSDDLYVSWVVYAAEHGYRFEGFEYWDSFEKRTPWWGGLGGPRRLCKWFETFSKAYGGVIPDGPWSETYNKICWPVTHALLPKDLQLQLAQALHCAQTAISNAAHISDTELGSLIKRFSKLPSKRYEHFLQGEKIVGQVVRAILSSSDDDSSGIHPPTLARISADMTEKANAKEWIRVARERYAERRCDSSDRACAMRKPPNR